MNGSPSEPFAMQPSLTGLTYSICAPTQVWANRFGQVEASGAQGVYHGDIRVLSRAVLSVDDRELEWRPGASVNDAEVGNIRVRQRRHVHSSGVREELSISADAQDRAGVVVRLHLSSDLAYVAAVKAQSAVELRRVADTGPGRVVWRTGGMTVTVAGQSADLEYDDARPALVWSVALNGGETVLVWDLTVTDETAPVVAAARQQPEWSAPQVDSADARLPRFVARSLDDLASLRLSLRAQPGDTFLAAGAPWYLTLFGRDALWAARMLLPLGHELAAGTLRALALLQGAHTDAETGEEPGKILHEVRRSDQGYGRGDLDLPPTYYGSVDATALWVCLLHDAWRWGMPDGAVVALLPHLTQALSWITGHKGADGSVFVRYVDTSGHGLSNQGWKDSSDSIRWMDGRIADGPIALCEVQAYTYEAAQAGAELIDAFDYGDSDSIRAWAEQLRRQFRDAFWVENAAGWFPALALDREGYAVDSVTSNMGHLLGTGLVNADEEELIVAQLMGAALDSGFGIRTLSTLSQVYDPASYHRGSVWPHDTAIALAGLAKSGHPVAAARLVEGLLSAAESMGYRLPELYSGNAMAGGAAPAPYAHACRPQAWSSASAVVVLTAVLGMTPDFPRRSVAFAPPKPSLIGPVSVRGLCIGGDSLGVTLAADGSVGDVTYDGVCTVAVKA